MPNPSHRQAMRRARCSGRRFLDTRKEPGSGRGAAPPLASLISRNLHPSGAHCFWSGDSQTSSFSRFDVSFPSGDS
ncbi:hypothetical protein GUJ93_ZPchr0004g39158 [Zizania palustris]|uniref:Uncharacterized protein n=1 Tax=Zizania palustris TaxID=103762 RepID=A0A8J5RZI0_ZIZPA|nr:hypothetical protein GUJ93_ZPchr0004g39158 [Zizania palustris]